MGWIISPVHAAGLSPAHSIWAGSGPAQNGWARSGPVFFFKKIQKYFFGILQFSRVFFMSFWLISSSIFMLLKIQNRILKYPVFVKTSKIQKTLKKKKLFLCIRPSVSKIKNHIVFFTPKNNVLACILALITSLLKSREHWPKFQKKQQKKFILFCLLVSRVRYYM